MQVVFDLSTRVINRATVVACHTKGQSCVMSGLAFVTDYIAEMFKIQHIFAYDGFPWGGGLLPINLHFRKLSSSWCYKL